MCQHTSELEGNTWVEIFNNIPSYNIRMFSVFTTTIPDLVLGSDALTHTLVVFKAFADWGFAFDIGHDANDIWFTSMNDGIVAGWKPLV